mmetsp:Transcript_32504/g.77218  ORF Transcript_32504/g.77218 Transcript_32504/m.77218 type:complete len:250 (-) Transcript_32504:289-1038(-)
MLGMFSAGGMWPFTRMPALEPRASALVEPGSMNGLSPAELFKQLAGRLLAALGVLPTALGVWPTAPLSASLQVFEAAGPWVPRCRELRRVLRRDARAQPDRLLWRLAVPRTKSPPSDAQCRPRTLLAGGSDVSPVILMSLHASRSVFVEQTCISSVAMPSARCGVLRVCSSKSSTRCRFSSSCMDSASMSLASLPKGFSMSSAMALRDQKTKTCRKLKSAPHQGVATNCATTMGVAIQCIMRSQLHVCM